MHCFIYRDLPLAFDRFGVVVLKASMLNCKGGKVVIGICALFYIYISAMSCAKFGIVVFMASMLNWRGDIGIYALFYIYKSAIRFAKFCVVVIKALCSIAREVKW